ncbi:hypothetical protein ACFVXC_16525 [Streptomyces sp. NPDC058257]|uniref:hypothetical protein n=1 Tax=Streptomyces sp. NPDC058257 TaxID=3346409 RepID=UPI0036E1A194
MTRHDAVGTQFTVEPMPVLPVVRSVVAGRTPLARRAPYAGVATPLSYLGRPLDTVSRSLDMVSRLLGTVSRS